MIFFLLLFMLCIFIYHNNTHSIVPSTTAANISFKLDCIRVYHNNNNNNGTKTVTFNILNVFYVYIMYVIYVQNYARNNSHE